MDSTLSSMLIKNYTLSKLRLEPQSEVLPFEKKFQVTKFDLKASLGSIYSVLPITFTSGLVGTGEKGLFAYKVREVQSCHKRSEEIVLHKMSNLGEKIYDVEIDFMGNIYYTSFRNSKLYKINSKTHHESTMASLKIQGKFED